MKKLFFIVTALIIQSICFQESYAKGSGRIKIFACEAEWASLAKEIVGDRAEISTAVSSFENPFLIEDKSALLSKVRSADLVFCNGGDLEKEWLPDLLVGASNNPSIQMGGDGYLMAYDYANKLATSSKYVHLNPHNIPLIAAELLKRINKINQNQVNAAYYQNNYDQFIQKWNESVYNWDKAAQNLQNTSVVINNDVWAYLIDWLNFKVVAQITSDPAIKPDQKHLTQIAADLKDNPAQIIIYASFEDIQPIMWLNNKTKIKAVALPFTVYGASYTNNLFDLFNNTILALTSGLQGVEVVKRVNMILTVPVK